MKERIVKETMHRMAGRVQSSLVSTPYMPHAYIIASRVVPIALIPASMLTTKSTLPKTKFSGSGVL